MPGELGAKLLGGRPPALVLASPRVRARTTAELAGLHLDRVDDRLAEWDYGDYEGLTTPQIRETAPGWTVWTQPVPGGETPAQVQARADALLADVTAVLPRGDVVLVGHAHFSRVLTARGGSRCLPPRASASRWTRPHGRCLATSAGAAPAPT